ncbi:MAG: ABC transporter substrate-binding protein [Succinivibrionaceae bacterium]|nr:ABC transporter substrate-binding protein [Succinivibrionaceae bacterium]
MSKNGTVFLPLAVSAAILASGIFLMAQGGLVSRGDSAEYRTERIAAVNASPVYRLSLVYDGSDWIENMIYRTARRYVEKVNAAGGIGGKKFELAGYQAPSDQISTLARIQSACAPSDVAACIGPLNSSHVVSARSIATFASVPLLTPGAVYSEKLRPMDGDTYVSAFPPLHALVSATIAHMREHDVDDLIIVCPEKGSYGDLYSTLLERYGQQMGGFNIMHRLTFQMPLNELAVGSALKTVLAGHSFEAVFYAGDIDDFDRFMNVYRKLGLTQPVYSTEVVNTPHVRQTRYGARIFIPFFNTDYLSSVIRFGNGIPFDEDNPDFSFTVIWLMDSIAGYLAKGGYDPVDMAGQLRREFESKYREMDLQAAFFIDDISWRETPEEAGEPVAQDDRAGSELQGSGN